MPAITPSARVAWWRPLDRADRWALALLSVLPLIVFTVPALWGSPAVVADNLLQNFPLRVLVGQQLRGGHLPLFNPLTNSGAPLLGGMNAGALFPLTFLFVVLPPLVAWVLNLAAVYAAAGAGLFALARRHGISSRSSLVGALVYAWGGPMVGQLVHLGVIQGYALLPWLVIALQSLGRAWQLESQRAGRERLWSFVPGVVGVAGLWGLAFLTGEPRAIAEVELLTLVMVPALIWVTGPDQPRRWRDRLGFAASVGGGVVWGAGEAAAQLLPAWSYIGITQRHAISYWFFGSGSLAVRWSSMWFLQDVVGGSGSWGQPHFFAKYNLPEVTIYTTIAALVAVAAFVVRRRRGGWVDGDRGYVPYLAVIMVGLFATWGSFLPTGHLFHLIPLFGNTRLQSRNAVLVALAACVLLAKWLDAWATDDDRAATLRGWRTWVTVSPAIITVVFAGSVAVAGEPIARFLGAMDNSPQARGLVGSALCQAALALLLVVVILRRPRRRVATVTALIVLDLVTFIGFNSTGFTPSTSVVEPSRTAVVSVLGDHGRTALVDATGASNLLFAQWGGANLNVFTRLPSVQGYGSLIDNRYNAVTQTHTLFSLNACAAARGEFDQLRLGTLALGWKTLSVPVSVESRRAVWCTPAREQTSTVRYFGRSILVSSVEAAGPRTAIVVRGPMTVRLLDAHGRPVGPAVAGVANPDQPTHSRVFSLAHPRRAWGVEFLAPGGETVTSAYVTDAATSTKYLLDTQFQQVVDNGNWVPRTESGDVTVFWARHVRPAQWVAHPGSGTVTHVRQGSWGDSWVTMVSHGGNSTLMRATAWLPGWRATAVNDLTGEVRPLPVRRHGLIQAVSVPAGTWTVHFHYHAPYIVLGLSLSVACSVALLAVWWADLTKRRRINR